MSTTSSSLNVADPAAPSPAEAPWRPLGNPWVITLAVTLATFMEILDTSVANVALPHIAGGLSAGEDEATWVLTSYLVSNAIILPMSGWFSVMLGRKRFYMGCVIVFTVSSLLCGLAPTLPLLILFRVIQGLGGGGLQPSEQAILADTFSPEKRGMAFAVYGFAVVLAPAIGPTLGGYITDNFSWRWIFLINIPVGILSLFLTQRLVQDPPYLKKNREAMAGIRVDYIGLGLLTVGLGLLQVVLDKGQRDDWFESPYIVIFSAIAVLSLVTVVFWELRQKSPIVDFRLLKDRTFLAANSLMFMVGFVLLSSTVLLPLFLQTLMGYTAQEAGMVISPGGLAIMIVMPLVGYLVSKFDPRYLIALGMMILSASLFHMSTFDLDINFQTAMSARVFQALGMAFLFVPINTIAFSAVPAGKNNAASGLINLARNVGGSIGISLVTTMLARRAQFHQNVMVNGINNSNPVFRARAAGIAQALRRSGSDPAQAAQQAYKLIYGSIIRQATMLAYIDCFKLLGIVVAVMVPAVFFMKRPKSGKAVMGH